MKANNYNQSYTNENIDEPHRDLWEGFPVYPGSEAIYNSSNEQGECKIYGFSEDNQIIWMRTLGQSN